MKKLIILAVFFTAVVFAGTFTAAKSAQAFNINFPGHCDGYQLIISGSLVGGTHTGSCVSGDASGSVGYFFGTEPFLTPGVGVSVVGGSFDWLYIFNFTTMTGAVYSNGSGVVAPALLEVFPIAFGPAAAASIGESPAGQ